MKYPLRAAAVAIAVAGLSLVPGADAGTTKGKVMVFEYDDDHTTITGIETNWNVKKLRHLVGTSHVFIDDPNTIPQGKCRKLAVRWNIGVFQNKADKFFTRLLDKGAKANCRFAFISSDIQNINGSYDLGSIGPTHE